MTAIATGPSGTLNITASNRGKLRNGNPSGDYLKAPRCGARTRAGGCCAQPAMKNGRCRFHGGKSTGARTAEGRARCAAARRTHGFYDAETTALLRDARAANRQFRKLLADLPRKPRGRPPGPRRPAGHGVLPSNRPNSAPAAGVAPSRRSAPAAPAPTVQRPVPPAPVPAGHGVLPPSWRLTGSALARLLGRSAR